MEGNNQDRFVDDLLDASLKQFRGEEPRPGLEGRILASVRAREGAVRQGLRTWVWAVGAVAALTAVILIVNTSRRAGTRVSSAPTVPRAGASGPKAPRAAAETLPQVAARKFVPASIRTTVTQPSYSQEFPTPAPLTDQEKLLLAFVAAIPKSQLSAVTEQPQEIEIPDLSIAALDIKPLPGPTNGQEK